MKVGREDIFIPTVVDESSYEVSNNNGVKSSKLCQSKTLVVESTMFPDCDIHKYTCTSPEGKTYSQIYHILIDRRHHSSILDV
jgi:hypothetical protein